MASPVMMPRTGDRYRHHGGEVVTYLGTRVVTVDRRTRTHLVLRRADGSELVLSQKTLSEHYAVLPRPSGEAA